jgi:rubrerythrin
MEYEAANRYGELAEDMRRQDKHDLAHVFTQLAAAEREHVDSVARWSRSRRGKDPDPALVRWEASETFDAEAATEVKTSRLMTQYRALAMAMQRGAGLRLLVLSRRVFRRFRDQEGRRVQGQRGARSRRDAAE